MSEINSAIRRAGSAIRRHTSGRLTYDIVTKHSEYSCISELLYWCHFTFRTLRFSDGLERLRDIPEDDIDPAIKSLLTILDTAQPQLMRLSNYERALGIRFHLGPILLSILCRDLDKHTKCVYKKSLVYLIHFRGDLVAKWKGDLVPFTPQSRLLSSSMSCSRERDET